MTHLAGPLRVLKIEPGKVVLFTEILDQLARNHPPFFMLQGEAIEGETSQKSDSELNRQFLAHSQSQNPSPDHRQKLMIGESAHLALNLHSVGGVEFLGSVEADEVGDESLLFGFAERGEQVVVAVVSPLELMNLMVEHYYLLN